MSTKISYKTMTDAELIDEGLDCEPNSLAYELAITLDALPIHEGIVRCDDKERVVCNCDDRDCEGCVELQGKVSDLKSDLSSAQEQISATNITVDNIVLKSASCPSCKWPINADDFKSLAEQTVMNGGAYAHAHFCKNCDHLMMVASSSSTTVTLTTTEPKP